MVINSKTWAHLQRFQLKNFQVWWLNDFFDTTLASKERWDKFRAGVGEQKLGPNVRRNKSLIKQILGE